MIFWLFFTIAAASISPSSLQSQVSLELMKTELKIGKVLSPLLPKALQLQLYFTAIPSTVAQDTSVDCKKIKFYKTNSSQFWRRQDFFALQYNFCLEELKVDFFKMTTEEIFWLIEGFQQWKNFKRLILHEVHCEELAVLGKAFAESTATELEFLNCSAHSISNILKECASKITSLTIRLAREGSEIEQILGQYSFPFLTKLTIKEYPIPIYLFEPMQTIEMQWFSYVFTEQLFKAIARMEKLQDLKISGREVESSDQIEFNLPIRSLNLLETNIKMNLKSQTLKVLKVNMQNEQVTFKLNPSIESVVLEQLRISQHIELLSEALKQCKEVSLLNPIDLQELGQLEIPPFVSNAKLSIQFEYSDNGEENLMRLFPSIRELSLATQSPKIFDSFCKLEALSSLSLHFSNQETVNALFALHSQGKLPRLKHLALSSHLRVQPCAFQVETLDISKCQSTRKHRIFQFLNSSTLKHLKIDFLTQDVFEYFLVHSKVESLGYRRKFEGFWIKQPEKNIYLIEDE